MRTGNLPDGEYTICITAIDAKGEAMSEEACVEHRIESVVEHLLDVLFVVNPQSLIIQDRPGTRRTLQRVAHQLGYAWADPRDPTEVKRAENIKSDLLDLELMARDFELPLLLQWISLHPKWGKHATSMRATLTEAGFVRGLSRLPMRCRELQQDLEKYSAPFSGRLSLQSLIDHWIKFEWVREPLFWTQFFSEWILDLLLIGLQNRKRPLWFWYEQMRDRLQQARPLGKPERVKGGLALYRVDQAVSRTVNASTGAQIFGIDSAFFEG